MIVWCIDVVGTIVISVILMSFAVYGFFLLLENAVDSCRCWLFNRKLSKLEKRPKKMKSKIRSRNRICSNCGRDIEENELKTNPNVSMCRHCRLTSFDGPDLYDRGDCGFES